MRSLHHTLNALQAMSQLEIMAHVGVDPHVNAVNKEPEPEKSRQVRRQEERERKKGRRDVFD